MVANGNLVVLTAYLFQRGSAESRDLDEAENETKRSKCHQLNTRYYARRTATLRRRFGYPSVKSLRSKTVFDPELLPENPIPRCDRTRDAPTAYL